MTVAVGTGRAHGAIGAACPRSASLPTPKVVDDELTIAEPHELAWEEEKVHRLVKRTAVFADGRSHPAFGPR
jgi:hypothetical protein